MKWNHRALIIDLKTMEENVRRFVENCCGCSLSNYEFTNIVLNEEARMSFLFKHGVLNETAHCPKCDSVMKISTKQNKLVYRCRKSINNNEKCDVLCSARNGSFFDGVKVKKIGN